MRADLRLHFSHTAPESGLCGGRAIRSLALEHPGANTAIFVGLMDAVMLRSLVARCATPTGLCSCESPARTDATGRRIRTSNCSAIRPPASKASPRSAMSNMEIVIDGGRELPQAQGSVGVQAISTCRRSSVAPVIGRTRWPRMTIIKRQDGAGGGTAPGRGDQPRLLAATIRRLAIPAVVGRAVLMMFDTERTVTIVGRHAVRKSCCPSRGVPLTSRFHLTLAIPR